MKRLVIAPHMDDESMGCGGLLAKYPGEAVVVTVTQSGAQRAAEHERAMDLLGVRISQNLGFEDSRVERHMAELVGALDEVLARYRPDEVYLPYPSMHQDHIAVYEAGMRSCRVSMSAEHWFPPSVLVYDIASYDVNLYPTDLRWNVFEPLTEEQVNLKHAATMAYASENPSDVHPINATREIAAAVGRVRLLPYAEQYALVRNVRS